MIDNFLKLVNTSSANIKKFQNWLHLILEVLVVRDVDTVKVFNLVEKLYYYLTKGPGHVGRNKLGFPKL